MRWSVVRKWELLVIFPFHVRDPVMFHFCFGTPRVDGNLMSLLATFAQQLVISPLAHPCTRPYSQKGVCSRSRQGQSAGAGRALEHRQPQAHPVCVRQARSARLQWEAQLQAVSQGHHRSNHIVPFVMRRLRRRTGPTLGWMAGFAKRSCRSSAASLRTCRLAG